MRYRRGWRRLAYGVLGVVLAIAFAACNPFNPSNNETTQPGSALPPLKPFPEVLALDTPDLPEWIEQISPVDNAASLAQIRIRFQSPLIPLESLESPSQQALLDKFELVPELPGKFRFLTPRMVGFQSDIALPTATRFRVTLKSGLRDLADHQLAEDLAWTFNTPPIALSGLPGADTAAENFFPSELEPTLEFSANTVLDIDSIEKHIRLTPVGESHSVSVEAALIEEDSEENRNPRDRFNPDAVPHQYSITPKQTLKKATRYDLTFSPGLRPAQGNLASEEEFTRALKTYGPFAFEKLDFVGGPGQGSAYGRFMKGIGQLKFNNGIVASSALEEITVEPPPKESPQLLRAYDDDRVVGLNPWSLEPDTEYTFTLGAGLEDVFGQTLGEPVTVKYDTGDLSPSLWAPSGLSIFPANQDLQLNVSTVNLPENYKAAFATVQPEDLVYTSTAYPRDNIQLLPDPSQWQTISVENKQNVVKETAIPLSEKLSGRTGMLAYGVQAKTVQTEGQQQDPSYYGLVQLTNLGVFSQWFPESGIVRVHHL